MARTDLDRHTRRLAADITDLAQLIDHGLARLVNAVQEHDPFEARMAQQHLQRCDPTVAAIEEHIIDVFTLQQPLFAGDLRMIVGALEVCYHLRECGWYTLQQALRLDTRVATCVPILGTRVGAVGAATRHLLLTATDAFVRADRPLADRLLRASAPPTEETARAHEEPLRLTEPDCAAACRDFLQHLGHVGDHARAIAHCALRLECAG